MKKLFTIILIFAGFSAASQITRVKAEFEAGFHFLLQEYFKDCYNDSTKVEVHRQLTPDEAKKDACQIVWINQGTGFTQICENKRHSEIKYVHAEPRDFSRFILWMEERRKNASQ